MPYNDFVIMCETHLIPHYNHLECVGCVLDNLYNAVEALTEKVLKIEEKVNEN